jgi:hypothetical protein
MRIVKCTVVVLFVALSNSIIENGYAQSDTVKVFILAGQSNMEGKAKNTLLEHQVHAAKTMKLFSHLRSNDEWVVRDDAFIKFLDRSGGLTIGYGSPNKTGVELEFGTVLAEHFDEPVLLIKAAWGGHSLYQKFRPPSLGLPASERLEAELAKAVERVEKNNEKNNRSDALPTIKNITEPYGISYRAMLAEVADTQNNYQTMFPALQGKKLELSGFVWFQGFNDMFGEYAPQEYDANMKQFIFDLRKDFNAPNLPVVIGALGQHGTSDPSENMKKVQTAQMAMNHVAEFKGNVKSIYTHTLVDKEAERVFPGWKDHFEEWEKVGSDRPYHYLGSAIWFNRIGHAFAEEMLVLLKNADGRE